MGASAADNRFRPPMANADNASYVKRSRKCWAQYLWRHFGPWWPRTGPGPRKVVLVIHPSPETERAALAAAAEIGAEVHVID